MRGTPSKLLATAARLLCCAIALLVCYPVFAQDYEINRYTLYSGFDYLLSPARNLTQRGFDTDFGITVKPWLGLGVDFSASGNAIISGNGTINGSETIYAPILTGAAQQFPGLPIPPPSTIHVPFSSSTYTIAVGGQIYVRHWRPVTFLIRPGFGAMHEAADLKFPAQVAPLFMLLNVPTPAAHQTDTTWFIGMGGGFDLNLSRHVGFRFTADYINTHLFSNLLTDRQNYVRFTAGPTWRWGRL